MKLFTMLSAFSCLLVASVAHGQVDSKVDGIVLVISDGTSSGLLTAARVYAHGAEGRLALEELPHTAFVRTYSSSDVVTDSAASATAMARGAKAKNRAVGELHPPRPSILDIAKSAGWSTAVICDDEVTGGTPSPFMVEHPKRGEAWFIADKLVGQLGKRVDIVAGGGQVWFRDFGEAQYRGDVRGVVQETQRKLAESPVKVIGSWEDYVRLPGGSEDPVLATFWPSKFPYIADGERSPRLVEMTEQTVKLLRSRGKPFLLVIEASLPDKASHKNNAIRAIREVLEVDAVVGWLRENLTPETLLLVTTDHGTGGLALNGYMPLRVKGNAILGENPVSGASMLSWASGPGGASDANEYQVTGSGENGNEQKTARRAPTDPDYVQPAAMKAGAALHTGGDVWLLGAGPGSEKVRGFLDNTDIFRIMKEAIPPTP